MKQLSTLMILNIDGGDRISYTYNEISDSGDPISTNNKKSFYVADEELRRHVEAVREYIRTNKLAEV